MTKIVTDYGNRHFKQGMHTRTCTHTQWCNTTVYTDSIKKYLETRHGTFPYRSKRTTRRVHTRCTHTISTHSWLDDLKKEKGNRYGKLIPYKKGIPQAQGHKDLCDIQARTSGDLTAVVSRNKSDVQCANQNMQSTRR
jgi:hypothetical protein